MSGAISSAVAQVQRNRQDVELKFAMVFDGIPVRAVCILWTTEDSANDLQWIEHGDVIVIRGLSLNAWVRNLTDITFDQQKIEQVWKEIENYALEHDVDEFDLFGLPRPTIVAFTAFTLALYGLLALSHADLVWLTGGIIIFIGVGFGARKTPLLRQAALGWIVFSVAYFLILLGLIIRNLI
jgi:hypothetical protein